MNEVPHSEHVISRSGIAVSPRKRMEVHFLLFGALALRFFQPLGRGAKAALFSNARQKALASRRLIGASVLQWFGLFNFFITWGSFARKVSLVQKVLSLYEKSLHVRGMNLGQIYFIAYKFYM